MKNLEDYMLGCCNGCCECLTFYDAVRKADEQHVSICTNCGRITENELKQLKHVLDVALQFAVLGEIPESEISHEDRRRKITEQLEKAFQIIKTM